MEEQQRTVTHRESGHRGAFEILDGEEKLAEMTYSRLDAGTVLIDHTWVADSLRGQRVARKLLDAAVAWARATHTKVVPVCPYVKSEVERDASIRDVIA